jgi:eukaryotic-like serine/threonine-protein kinase
VADQPDPLLGATLADRYVIVRQLGEGGMGTVYLATHAALEKQIALKVLHAELARKPELVERFIQEAKAASRIRHENVIDISDFGKTGDGYVFFAMELLTGRDLASELLRANRAGLLLPWSRSKKIFLQVCSALAAAHAHGIVHRDLKPENVYLIEFAGDPDFVKLLDFGIAKVTEVNDPERKLTRTGVLFGTPEYMAPEQARGLPVDARMDVYAMGCLLFHLVTGHVPFEAENFMGVLSMHMSDPPPAIAGEVFDRIGAPRELAGVIERALRKDRDTRYQTINELASAVRAVCNEPQAVAATPAESVRAPAVTVMRAADVVSLPAHLRNTRWTGNLSVPSPDDDLVPTPRWRVPLAIAGGLAVAGGAVAVAIALTRDAGDAGDRAAPPAASPRTSAPAAAPRPPPAPPPPADAATATAPTDAVALAEAQITIDSTPHAAQVVDLATNQPIGKTPLTFKVPGSQAPRRYQLVLAGYQEVTVELVPDTPKQIFNERLVKAVAGGGAKPPRTPRDAGATTATPAEPQRPPQETCDDPPCGKPDHDEGSSAGAGSDEP